MNVLIDNALLFRKRQKFCGLTMPFKDERDECVLR